MQTVWKGGNRVVHAERVRIFDGGADLCEEGVDRGCELGHGAAHGLRRRRHEISILDRKQAFTQGRQARGRFRCWAVRTRCS